ncbi:UDP-3-O-(3-hydroxymyristoyl)glucosamine N-acyltransferase [bacterium]|nr:UDP-3-O-(3-hydroxymyristoyl)glucosamine N-acyltransferase [bacterium]MBT3580894.1 UDP-3-O-(3-hydroxymyristoyl)glucosamine N-acyltransferase [bacterium]MBT4551454.1 UDP-3-O-(3-hydroxymyristoyl)glucosamine N-acyltransferase [bacterium]
MNLRKIATQLAGTLIGNPDLEIISLASLDQAQANDLSFVLESKYIKESQASSAAAFITFKPINNLKNQIIVKNPRKALALAINLLSPAKPVETFNISSKTEIHKSAQLADQVQISAFTSIGEKTIIGTKTRIGSNVNIGQHVQIGQNCLIYPGVTIYDHTQIGDNVIIHAGSNIGVDGFGYYQENKKFLKIQHIGRVIIENNVEIGANTCIDRGCLGNTVVQQGTKIDNLNHLAHNTIIGKNCALAGLIGFAGSVTLGDNVLIGGQAGFNGHITIGDNVVVMAKTGVTKNLPSNTIVSGFPAQNHRLEMRKKAVLKKLVKKELKKGG